MAVAAFTVTVAITVTVGDEDIVMATAMAIVRVIVGATSTESTGMAAMAGITIGDTTIAVTAMAAIIMVTVVTIVTARDMDIMVHAPGVRSTPVDRISAISSVRADATTEFIDGCKAFSVGMNHRDISREQEKVFRIGG